MENVATAGSSCMRLIHAAMGSMAADATVSPTVNRTKTVSETIIRPMRNALLIIDMWGDCREKVILRTQTYEKL